jgi:hypothetical protein
LPRPGMGLEKLSSWSFSKASICAGRSISKMIFFAPSRPALAG